MNFRMVVIVEMVQEVRCLHQDDVCQDSSAIHSTSSIMGAVQLVVSTSPASLVTCLLVMVRVSKRIIFVFISFLYFAFICLSYPLSLSSFCSTPFMPLSPFLLLLYLFPIPSTSQSPSFLTLPCFLSPATILNVTLSILTQAKTLTKLSELQM